MNKKQTFTRHQNTKRMPGTKLKTIKCNYFIYNCLNETGEKKKKIAFHISGPSNLLVDRRKSMVKLITIKRENYAYYGYKATSTIYISSKMAQFRVRNH